MQKRFSSFFALPKKRSQKSLDYVMKAKIVINLSYERQTR